MKARRLIESLIYIVLIIVALAIVVLTVAAPAQWSDVGVVYRGF